MALLAAAGCGGGGGGSGAIGQRPPSFFETNEYFASGGLDTIGASSAYGAGANGSGVLVGVIDTGIDLDHPEFAGVIHNQSIDIVTGSAATLGDEDGHGTAVAGVIAARRNDALTHGVAFGSRLLAVRADLPNSCQTNCVFDQAHVAAATDYAVARGARVINYSIGGSSALGATLAGALQHAVDAGRVLVFAAGNDSSANPAFPGRFAESAEARGQAIAVGALDTNGQLASFSNRAGSTQDFYLVAPGVQIRAPALNGSTALVSGTSFAAPHVAGAAALILDAAPFLSAGQVVELLLDTATDLGAPGTDAVYGRGLLNLAAALAPNGSLSVPLGDAVDGPAAPLGATGLRLGGAFGKGPKLGRAIFLDGYGRPYWIDLDRRRSSTETGPDLHRWLAPREGQLTFSPPGSYGALSLHLDAPRDATSLGSSRDPDPRLSENFALSAVLGAGSRVALTHGWSLQGQFGLAGDQDSVAPGLLTADRFASPYLALADGGDGVALAHALGDAWTLRVGLGRAERDGPPHHGSAENTVVLGELVRTANQHWRVGLQFGQLEEQRRMLDASGGGALGLPEGASTTFVGLSGRTQLAPALELFGQANLGITRPNGSRPVLLQDLSMLTSSSFALGVARGSLATAGDRLAVTVAQPLRVEAGAAEIDRPLGRSFDGRILRQRGSVELAPDGRELDLEVGYLLPLTGVGELSLNWLSRLQPDHDADARPEHVVALKVRRRW